MHFDGSRFSLRPRVLELGFAYLSSLSLPEVAEPHMEALVARINESSSISVLDDIDVVYVARVPTRRIMSITLAVGTRLPAYATSMGRVLLAGLAADAELEERLARIDVQPLTPRTVKSHDALRAVLDQVRRRATRSPTRSSSRACARPRCRSTTPPDAVVAALNVSVHASRATMSELRARFLPPARAAAEAIDAELRKSGLRATGAATARLARG